MEDTPIPPPEIVDYVPPPQDDRQPMPEAQTPTDSGFPIDALPEPLRSMVIDAARQTGTPPALCAAAGLGTASASIGSAYRVRSGEGRETPANLFLLSFADSGTGKGQAFGVMAKPLHDSVRELAEVWTREERPRLMAELEAANADLERGRKELRGNPETSDISAAMDAVRRAVKRQADAENALARSPMINIGNATAEAIVEALCHAPGEAATMISAEARDIVDNLLGRYSKTGKGSDEAIFLQSFSGDAVVHSRKGKAPLTLSSPCLSLCLAAQPDIWEKMSGDSRLMESGFLPRCLTFDAKAKASRPSSYRIPDGVKNRWADAIGKLIEIRQITETPAIVMPSREAQEIIDHLADHAADMRDDGGGWNWCRPFAARLAENAWRLAVVLHAIQHPADAARHPLTGTAAANAATLANWFFRQTLDLLAPVRSKKWTARMERLIAVFKERGAASISMRDLNRSHNFNEAELVALAEEFPARMSILKTKPGPQGGQPSRLVCIPPRITPVTEPTIPTEPTPNQTASR